MIFKKIAFYIIFFLSVVNAQQVKEFLKTISSLSEKEQIDSIINYSYTIKNSSPLFKELNDSAYNKAFKLDYKEAIGISLSNLGLWDNYQKDFNEAIRKYDLAKSYIEKTDRFLELGLLYNRYGNALHQINKNSEAINNFKKSIELRKSIDDKVGIGYAYTNIGLIYWRTGRYDSALVNYEEALKVRLLLDDKKLIASNYNNIAVLYYHWGRFEEALDFYLKSYELRKSIDDYYGLAIVLNNIGLINLDRNELSEAKENFYEALIFAKKSEDQSAIGYSYNGIASSFKTEKLYDSAYYYYQQSLNQYSKADHFGGMVLNLINLGDLLIEMKLYQEAEEYLDEALKLSEPRSENLRIAQVYLYKSDIRSENNKKYEAVALLEKSLEIAKGVNKIDLLVSIYERLSDRYSDINNFSKALEYYKLFKIESDKLTAEKNSNKMLEIQFENQKAKELKEKEILLEKEEAQTNLFITIAVAFAVLAIVLTFIIIYIKRSARILEIKNEEIQNQKKLLELQKEELNNKNEELNEVNNTKDKFFSILAHDLKNPFGALIGYTSLLLDEIEILDKTEIKDIVEKTNSVSNNSFQLLENLLSWARSQTGVLTINHKEIELSNLINETTTLFHDIAVSKNININCNLNEKVVINSDEDILRTIFRNVISNAIKFSYQKSKIDITLFKQNGDAVFEVKDYGMGMDAETLDSLFRIDVNISNLGTNNEKGTGLGLILTNEFVRKINGKIYVESSPNLGSKFTILLPLNN